MAMHEGVLLMNKPVLAYYSFLIILLILFLYFFSSFSSHFHHFSRHCLCLFLSCLVTVYGREKTLSNFSPQTLVTTM